MTRIRALVVEDSLTVRKYLVDVLQSDPDLEVIGEASDGKQGIELCELLRPDVITLDMMLPIMNGLAATEYIMAYCPTPIIIVSASTNRGELFKTYDALAAGAVDVFDKPLGEPSRGDSSWERRFTSAVKIVSRVKVITHPRARLRSLQCSVPTSLPRAPSAGDSGRPFDYVAMGASTGGPQALAAILSALPADFPLPILLVMHISMAFGAAFADWLGEVSALPVSMAIDGAPLPSAGTPGVLLAPPDRHLVLRDGRTRLTCDPEVHSCRPSVDVLFHSVAEEIGARAAAVLLTGMGRDGAQGMLAIRRAGGMTFAQNETSSVVFGMPREAILLGAAQRVLALDEVAPALVALGGAFEREGRKT